MRQIVSRLTATFLIRHPLVMSIVNQTELERDRTNAPRNLPLVAGAFLPTGLGLAEAGGIAKLPGNSFQEVVIALVLGLLHSSFFRDHGNDALGGCGAHYGIEFVSAVQVGFNQNQLVGRNFAQLWLNRLGCSPSPQFGTTDSRALSWTTSVPAT